MPGTRPFFLVLLTIAVLLLLSPLLIIAARVSDEQAGAQFLQSADDHADANLALTASGFGVWRAYGCEGCHTLNGEGSGDYAPDLTHIYTRRGEAYLRAFLVDPQAAHPNNPTGRTMPRFGLTRDETDALLVFLQSTSENAEGIWPPRPIMVAGAGGQALLPTLESQASAADALNAPATLGRALFSQAPANCATCHSLEPDVVLVGPSLAGIASRAADRVPGQSAATYLRISIIEPGAFLVPGFQNVMQQNFGEALDGGQVEALIAFMLTLD